MAKSTVKAMTEFNKTSAVTLRAELNDALEAVAKKYGITLELGKMNYSPVAIRAELLMTPAKLAKGEKTSGQEAFEEHCAEFGIKKTALGTTFIIGKQEFVLTGINPRRPKFPIMAATTGKAPKSYKMRLSDLPEKFFTAKGKAMRG